MREYSMGSHDRRKHQRWLNAYCRMMNRSIANDPLWLGRFVIEQKSTAIKWFEDGSGGLLYCHLRFRDKKTDRVKDWYTDCLDLCWHGWFQMNDFIVKDCKVWELERPCEDRKDYRNVN